MNAPKAIERSVETRIQAQRGEWQRQEAERKTLLSRREGDWRKVDEPNRILTRARLLGLDDAVRKVLANPADLGAGARVYEQIIQRSNLLGVGFLYKGVAASRSVGRILVPVAGGTRLGTGFMVSPRLMMTNNHVLTRAQEAQVATFELDFFEREDGATEPTSRFLLEPELFFVTDGELDFTIVAVQAVNAAGERVADRGWHHLIPESGKAVAGEALNIIQHPDGRPQMVAIQENWMIGVTGSFLHYQTDTMGGSSGSPVFNNEWDLVGLHHAAVAEANEGIRVSSIVTRLQEILAGESAGGRSATGLTAELLDGRSAVWASSSATAAAPSSWVAHNGDGTATWTVPVRITIGVGDGPGAGVSAPLSPSPSRETPAGPLRHRPSPPERPTPPAQLLWPDEAPVVVKAGEIREALKRQASAPETLRGDVSGAQWNEFLVTLGKALDELEQEEAKADPDVMTVPRDRVASLLLSTLAEEPPAGSERVLLEAGGEELKFATNDIGGWLKSLFSHVNRDGFHPLVRPTGTEPRPLAGAARIALFGDWGTGLYGAPEIARSLREFPRTFDFLIHLGDVYYSGTKKEVRDRFLTPWPAREGEGSLALNSNHEMYSGGYGYFDLTLPQFGQASSYFALANDHWLLIGLDTGYVDHDLDAEQAKWVHRVIDQADGRKVILLSHHQLFSHFESQGSKLSKKLQNLLTDGHIAYWYWGHEHRCCLFDPAEKLGGLRARCLGHGGMPATRKGVQDLPETERNGEMIWRRVDGKKGRPGGLVLDGPNVHIKGKEKKYLPHGFLTLELDGPHLREQVYTAAGQLILQR